MPHLWRALGQSGLLASRTPLSALLGGIAAVAMAAPGQGAAVCSALSRHPCVYYPYHQACSPLHPHACIYEPNYWFGEQIQLTIHSVDTSATPAPDARPAAERPRLATLRQCWVPPDQQAARPGTQMSVRISFKRDGALFGKPKLTYVTPGIPQQIRQTYWDAITASLQHCTPLQLSKGLGGALAGRPFAIRFVDDRGRS